MLSRAVTLCVLVGSLAAGACGDDDGLADASAEGPNGAATRGGSGARDDGGSSTSPGGQGETRDGGLASALDGGAGDAGSGTSGRSGGAGPGTFDSHWKRRSVQLTVIDTANPTGFDQKSFDLPDRIANPVDGREVDLYIQIKDDTRYTYAHFEGDEVYYRMATALIRSEDTYFETDADGNHLYQLVDGVLKDTGGTVMGTLSTSSEATYEKAAEFPPRGWPSQMLETQEIMP